MINELCNALENSLSPDNALRRNAEKIVFDSMAMNGFCSAMLHIATETKFMEGRKVNVAQAAAIQFKNIADIHWKFKSEAHAQDICSSGFRYIILAEEDKNYVKNNILELILHCKDEDVNRQLNYAVEWIVRNDFPDKWPLLANKVKDYIHDQEDEIKILLGLETLRSVCKRYEYEYEAKRNPLNEIIDTLFPKIEEIASQIQDNPSHDAFGKKKYTKNWLFCFSLFLKFQILLNFMSS